jgi:hypothetical protein
MNIPTTRSTFMSCVSNAQGTPRWLQIMSVVKSKVGLCSVDAQHSASHDIEIKNWSGMRHFVTIDGECQTPCVRYQGTNGPQQAWNRDLLVPFCPGSGGPGRATASQPLTSLCASRDQRIRTTLTWYAVGLPKSLRRESLDAHVKTL